MNIKTYGLTGPEKTPLSTVEELAVAAFLRMFHDNRSPSTATEAKLIQEHPFTQRPRKRIECRVIK